MNLKQYINNYNGQHGPLEIEKTKTGYRIVNEKTRETMAWARTTEELEIMLMLKHDKFQDENPYYWLTFLEWGYKPSFLDEIMKRKGKKYV